MSLVITDLGKDLITVLNDGCALIGSYGRYAVTHIKDHPGIVNYYLFCLVTAKIIKLSHHLICRS